MMIGGTTSQHHIVMIPVCVCASSLESLHDARCFIKGVLFSIIPSLDLFLLDLWIVVTV